MNLYTILNVISNITIAFSAGALLIHILGDPDNSIWDDTIKAYLAKLGLSITTCGAVVNVLTLSTPNKTEILLNVGMSVTFFWLSRWQWEQFKLLKASTNKQTPPQPTSEAINTPKPDSNTIKTKNTKTVKLNKTNNKIAATPKNTKSPKQKVIQP